MNIKTKCFTERIKTDEKFRKDFIIEIATVIHQCMSEKNDEQRRYAHYVIFTPLWKQISNKIRGKKPYENPHYKPTI